MKSDKYISTTRVSAIIEPTPDNILLVGPIALGSILGIKTGMNKYIAIAIMPYHHCGAKKNVSTINTNVATRHGIDITPPILEV